MKRYRLFLPIFLFLCFACTQFDEEAMLDEAPTTRAAVNAAALRESAGIANTDNPYSVDNMKAAMIQYCKVMNIQPRPVYATHEYVRFEVRDSLDYYILEDSLGLEMFTYPLDRMLNNAERSFYATDIVNGKKWYYTVVPKNFRYPTEMPKQILQEIYMQGGTVLSGASAASGPSTRIIGGGSTGSSQIDDSLYDAVLNLSMKNAGIDTDDGPSPAAGWTPSACILYEDDLTHEKLPLKNVTVRVNTFVNIGTGQTDERGYVAIPEGWGGKFRNRVDYEVKFKNNRFKILEHHTGLPPVKAVLRTQTKQTRQSQEKATVQAETDVQMESETADRTTEVSQTEQVEEKKPSGGINILRLSVGVLFLAVAVFVIWIFYKRIKR